MRRVLLIVATALAFTQNRRRPRGRRRDVLRHAGADDEFVRNAWATAKANLPAIVTGAWDPSAGDDEPGGALANLALVRTYQRDTPSPRRTTRHAQAYRSSRSWPTTRSTSCATGRR